MSTAAVTAALGPAAARCNTNTHTAQVQPTSALVRGVSKELYSPVVPPAPVRD